MLVGLFMKSNGSHGATHSQMQAGESGGQKPKTEFNGLILGCIKRWGGDRDVWWVEVTLLVYLQPLLPLSLLYSLLTLLSLLLRPIGRSKGLVFTVD